MKSFHLAGTLFGSASVFAGECRLPLDVVFIQDTTGTLRDVLPTIAGQISDIATSILAENPDSRFGLAHFRDKPFFPFGIESDFCYEVRSSLISEIPTLQSQYSALTTTSGGDLPDGHYHALVNAAADPALKWRDLSWPAGENGETAGARVAVLITDSEPHLEGDVPRFNRLYPDSVPELPSYPTFDPISNFTAACLEYDYPSPTTVGNTLELNAVSVLTVTPAIPSVSASWDWVNEQLLLQPAALRQTVQPDFSDLKEKILAALRSVTTEACARPLPPTTTAPPSSIIATSRLEPDEPLQTPGVSDLSTTAADASTITSGPATIPSSTKLPVTTPDDLAPVSADTASTASADPVTTSANSEVTSTVPAELQTSPPITDVIITIPDDLITLPAETEVTVTIPNDLITVSKETGDEQTSFSAPAAGSSAVLITDVAPGQNCTVPCPAVGPCCENPKVLIEVKNNPKKLTVDYES